jgi:hypothetical protein
LLAIIPLQAHCQDAGPQCCLFIKGLALLEVDSTTEGKQLNG